MGAGAVGVKPKPPMVEINAKPPRVDVECSPNKKQQLKDMDVDLPIELSIVSRERVGYSR